MSQWAHKAAIFAALDRLEEHCPGQRGHAERVSVYAVATAERLAFSLDDLATVRDAALLHDLGKLAIESELLNGRGTLDREGLLMMKVHCDAFAWIADSLGLPSEILALGPIVVAHHERWDGTGYPMQLAGEAIPPAARVISVAEVFDAMVTGSWKPPMPEEETLAAIRELSGHAFEPAAVEAFFRVQPLIQPVAEPLAGPPRSMPRAARRWRASRPDSR
ncbi:MAG: HD domain-containing protein [Fimbriimonas ginsengisoli]|uniref:HD domain-containing protein n=1 Tax=Fimbriimonas ginsengisoli TaxID=1005039 RepID=A0A931LX05_FIMGI|nr:HD domain-containing protein [Fimbriimonas ginsengisoli]